ncbi:hypothetical protein HG535_0C01250 [Zygotorulaspora mrakii]|uniref:C3H1-type domain-containing protein n=1 Tax=Zygotorulaspora mrakii TaxID=42260 RepID=A0A7H9AZX0_ZYGMR|nr:uncharacterized protein HG535_0C01250 [Zygotorulaspora mrakii]QLG71776.1 hypothetical protein HG535_0C01250 [Zygotorulaspora mrakii]
MGSERHNSSQQRSRARSGQNQRSDETGKRRFTFGSKSGGNGNGRDGQGHEGHKKLAGEHADQGAKQGFTPQQQKVIIEHLLITKSNAPQKNYSHVPCKFFRQGSCQAGDSCPFSHSLDTTTADQTPCEYFKRGNCKFGSKCANAHILPDGVRVNPPRQFKTRSSSSREGVTQPQFQAQAQAQVQALALAQAHTQAHGHAIVENCIYEEEEPRAGSSVEDVSQVDVEDECEEFYIPRDFADLLTPEELRRRNSRSSSSSIPSSFKNPEFSHSRSLSSSSSSYGSEPLFSPTISTNNGYHQRAYSNASLSSSNSSTTVSPLLHQQLSNFQQPQWTPISQNYSYHNYNSTKNDTNYLTPKTQQSTKVTYSPWFPPMLHDSSTSRGAISWLGSDLTRLKIDEEAVDELSSTDADVDAAIASLSSFGKNTSNYRQDTQFFFDDIPVRFDHAQLSYTK